MSATIKAHNKLAKDKSCKFCNLAEGSFYSPNLSTIEYYLRNKRGITNYLHYQQDLKLRATSNVKGISVSSMMLTHILRDLSNHLISWSIEIKSPNSRDNTTVASKIILRTSKA